MDKCSDSLPPALVDDFSEESSFYEILPCCARFRCGELIVEGQWHHLVLLMSKGMLKNSTAALYIDGQLVSTVKVSILHQETAVLKTAPERRWWGMGVHMQLCGTFEVSLWTLQ